MRRENQNKKKELSDLKERLLKKEALAKEKEQADKAPKPTASSSKLPKTTPKLTTMASLENPSPTKKEEPKVERERKPVVRSQTYSTSVPRPPSRRPDMDIALAMALQAEELELNEQLFMIEMMEERDRQMQAMGQDQVDPDNMTYEELMELQERVGKVKVGLTAAQVAKLKTELYSSSTHKLNSCSICLNEFEERQPIVKLKCLHLFDPDCLKRWLEDNKNCPICKGEVTV